jgi:glucose/galactose transporter
MSAPTKNYTSALILIGILFFTFGYITWTNGALIPILKIVCNLRTDVQAFFVTFAFYMAYTFLAIPSSAILRKTGFKGGMILGLIVVAVGSLIFIPAAQSRTYGLFLTGLFIQAAGLTILQTAVNPYVSILGPIESAAKRISIMGIFNKGAGIIAPLILGAVVLQKDDDVEGKLSSLTDAMARNQYLNELSERMILPYVILAAVLLAVALLIKRSNLPSLDPEQNEEITLVSDRKSVFHHPNLVLGIGAIFFYVGAEVIAGDAIGLYGRNLGIDIQKSTTFTAYTLTGMLIGYLFGIVAIPKYLSQEKALTISAIVGLILTAGAFMTSGMTSVYFMASLGIANAPMWPAIFPMGIKGLGKFTKTGSALLIMGIAGGAVMSLIFAAMMEAGNPQQAFWIMALCYVYILFYATRGHKIGYKDNK